MLTFGALEEKTLHVCFSDREYPRLGQMIVDYENPLKKMMEEFVPHGKVVMYWLFLSLVFQVPFFLLIRSHYRGAK